MGKMDNRMLKLKIKLNLIKTIIRLKKIKKKNQRVLILKIFLLKLIQQKKKY